MNTIDIFIYSGLVAAAIFAVIYGLPYVLIALVALGAIHHRQLRECYAVPKKEMDRLLPKKPRAERTKPLLKSRPGLDKRFNPRGAGAGYAPVGLVLSGHLVPAVPLDDIGSVVALRSHEFLDLRCMVRAFHELGDTDRRLARRDRLLGQLLRRP